MLKAANTDGKEEIKVSNGFHLDSKEPDWSKLPPQGRQPQHRDLATPTLLHFGNAQASLALRSTSAAPIMGEVRYDSLMKTFPQEAEVPKAANTSKN